MNDHLEKPDHTLYVKPKDCKRDGLCTAKEEIARCKGYKPSIVFGGCQYHSNVTGKCMRPDEVRK